MTHCSGPVAQELYLLLAEHDRDVTDMLESALLVQPFQLICQRLLHHADDEYLFYFANGILSRSSSHKSLQMLQRQHVLNPADSQQSAAAAASIQLEQMLLLILFGCIWWKDLDAMLISIACALHFQQVVKTLQAVDAVEVG